MIEFTEEEYDILRDYHYTNICEAYLDDGYDIDEAEESSIHVLIYSNDELIEDMLIDSTYEELKKLADDIKKNNNQLNNEFT